MDYIRETLQKLVDDMEKHIIKCKNDIVWSPKGHLETTVKGEKTYFYQTEYGSNGRERIGITKNQKLIGKLARKEYITREQKMLEYNINVIDRAIDKLKPLDPQSIINQMTRTYRKLPPEYFFTDRKGEGFYSFDKETQWKINSHKEWAEAEYEKSQGYRHHLTFMTTRGQMMRSKAEVLIAERLYFHGIPFRYEEILHLSDGTDIVPDFEFQDRNKENFYMEFCGMMDDEGYQASHIWKRTKYEENGIAPWKNIIYIYETGNNLSLEIIDAIIRYQIVPKL